MERIDAAIDRVRDRLCPGRSVELDMAEVEHPSQRPDLFHPLEHAWPAGQSCDWAWPQTDGSRIHVHCVTTDGRPKLRVHRDRWDPEQGATRAVAHGLLETPIGGLVLVVGVLGAAAAFGRRR